MGRIERSIFTCDWLLDLELRRRSHGNLNKGESRHALARAVFFHRLGELRDRTAEAMAYRASGPCRGRQRCWWRPWRADGLISLGLSGLTPSQFPSKELGLVGAPVASLSNDGPPVLVNVGPPLLV